MLKEHIFRTPKIQPIGKNMNGLFDYFLNNSIDPTESFLTVKTRDNFVQDNPNSVIHWKTGNGKWASGEGQYGWISLNFGSYPMLLTHFSFISFINYIYATEFKLYGMKNFNQWVYLQTFQSNNYCKNSQGLNPEYCDGEYIETWKLDIPAYYTAYKWEETKSSSSTMHYISMQGLDVFGQLNPFISQENHAFHIDIFISILLFII